MKYPTTRRGLRLLEDAIRAQRDRVTAIGGEVGEEAGQNCDWHDNFGFEDARRRLELESTRLQVLIAKLESVQIASIHEQNLVVALGVTVKLLVGQKELEYTIVGLGEGDADRRLISVDAPIAVAIYGLCEGDLAQLPGREPQVEIEILEILPPSYRYDLLFSRGH